MPVILVPAVQDEGAAFAALPEGAAAVGAAAKEEVEKAGRTALRRAGERRVRRRQVQDMVMLIKWLLEGVMAGRR